jgi:hypothetical protein
MMNLNINVKNVKVGIRNAFKSGSGILLSMTKFLTVNQKYIVIQLKTSNGLSADEKKDRTFILITKVPDADNWDFDTNNTSEDYNKILSKLIKSLSESYMEDENGNEIIV